MKRFANNTDAPSTPRTDRHPVQRLPHTPINERRAFIVHIIGQRTRRNDVARVFITARCALSARYHFRGTSCCNEPRFMLKCTRCAHTCHAVPRLPRLLTDGSVLYNASVLGKDFSARDTVRDHWRWIICASAARPGFVPILEQSTIAGGRFKHARW